jgi:phosphohistidine phosphatase
MKYLYLLRHAKSDWSDPLLSDMERPLNPRGIKNAPFMARLLATQTILPSLMLCSPALRTKQTAEFFRAALPQLEIHYAPELYLADPLVILEQIKKVDGNHNAIIVCGHNPGLTDLTNLLQVQNIKNLPTCSWVLLSIEKHSWQTLIEGCAKLLAYERPKKYK